MTEKEMMQKMQEEYAAISDFLYQKNASAWREYCDKNRAGNHSLEGLSMLMSSIGKYRFILLGDNLTPLFQAISNLGMIVCAQKAIADDPNETSICNICEREIFKPKNSPFWFHKDTKDRRCNILTNSETYAKPKV
jgi:hypothetical protein